MSLMSVGRLFQTSGPLTENARRPNCVLVRRTTAELVVDDHSWRWCALGLNATRSLRYGGERWWKIFYINVATLKVIRNLNYKFPGTLSWDFIVVLHAAFGSRMFCSAQLHWFDLLRIRTHGIWATASDPNTSIRYDTIRYCGLA